MMHPAGPPPAADAQHPVLPPGPRGRARPPSQGGRELLELLLFCVFYGSLMIATMQVGRKLGVFPALWPTDAVAVGLYFLLGHRTLGRHAMAVVAVAFLVRTGIFGEDFALALAAAAASGIMFTLVSWGCARAGMERDAFLSVPMVVNLTVVAVIGTLPGAVVAALVQFIDAGGGFASRLMRWWVPEMAGVVLLLPPFLLKAGREAAAFTEGAPPRLLSLSRAEEATLAVVALVISACAAAYFAQPLFIDIGAAVLLWFAFRLGVFPTALAASLFSLAMIALGVVRVWNAPYDSAMTALLHLQARLVLLTLPSLLIAAIMAQRARQQHELQEDRRRLAYALEGANDGICDWHVPTGAVFFSARAYRMLGYDPAVAPVRLSEYAALVHPDDLQTLKKSYRDHLEGRHLLFQSELRVRHRNGSYMWLLMRGKVVESDPRSMPVRAVGTVTDISQRKHLEAALEHAASHDPLTGLSNRAGFDRALEHARRRLVREGALFAVVLVDIDYFKTVNDRFGHMAGDLLLTTAARRLQSAIRAGDIVARYGGDEFAIVAQGRNKEEFAAMADRLHAHLSRPVEVEGLALPASFSMGMAVADDNSLDGPGLVAEADAALYAAKDAGRGTWRAVGVASRRPVPAEPPR